MHFLISREPPNNEVFLHKFGFNLFPFNSPVAGRGLFLEGEVKAGSLVSIYPGLMKASCLIFALGLVYQPTDPMVWPSIKNKYMLRRQDGFTIDGKYFGLSRKLFQSASSSIRWPIGTTVDSSWLRAIYTTRQNANSWVETLQEFFEEETKRIPTTEDALMLQTFHNINKNPLNQGQMINHGKIYDPQTKAHKDAQNVTYFEYFLPPKFPQKLRGFIPNLYFSLDNCELCSDVEEGLKMVVLISTRDIKNEELFSDYNWIGRPSIKE